MASLLVIQLLPGGGHWPERVPSRHPDSTPTLWLLAIARRHWDNSDHGLCRLAELFEVSEWDCETKPNHVCLDTANPAGNPDADIPVPERVTRNGCLYSAANLAYFYGVSSLSICQRSKARAEPATEKVPTW